MRNSKLLTIAAGILAVLAAFVYFLSRRSASDEWYTDVTEEEARELRSEREQYNARRVADEMAAEVQARSTAKAKTSTPDGQA